MRTEQMEQADHNEQTQAQFHETYRLIGRKVAYYRRLKGYTQVQLAQKIGISSNYLSQIECGRREKYSLHTLMMAAYALEIDLKELCE